MERSINRRRMRARMYGKGGLSRVSMTLLIAVAAFGLLISHVETLSSFTRAEDPGVRGGDPGAGEALDGISDSERGYFDVGKEDFEEAEEVEDGIGPRFNLDGCGGCHSQPAIGGTSPAENPQMKFGVGGTDTLPPFISLNGPVREARFVRNRDGSPDGGVHALFTISGREGAEGCSLEQPDFARQLANRNVIFRIPTPVFGAGLMELIPDYAILANQGAGVSAKSALGIRGRANFQVSGRTISGQTNNNGNDGTTARFGWKAQNKSLLLFSGEAYNVEMGITNDLFQTERDENPNCQFSNHPNSITDPDASTPIEALSSIEKFALFMRFLAPPVPSRVLPGGAQSIANGLSVFGNVGCAHCHTPSFTTAKSGVTAMRQVQVNLFSDLLIHDMGVGLADGVSQGGAGPREFRSAPLWGLGKRIFFLHDGRTTESHRRH